MRAGAYHLFEVVSWPAAAWCGVEILLRATSGAHDGSMAAAFTGACACATIGACRWRGRTLRVARVHSGSN